jgi:oligopeptide transport system substrate-binding protein
MCRSFLPFWSQIVFGLIHSVLFFLPLLLLSGCGQAPHQPGVLRVAQQADPSTLDPAKAYDTTSSSWVRVMYRGLVEYDNNSNLYNEVAKTREVSEDGKTYTFTLRDDVRYWDGTPVTAKDFRFALERVMDPATASDGLSLYTMIDGAEDYTKECNKEIELATKENRPRLKSDKHIRGIEVVGDHKIIFHLNRADATFLNYLALAFAYAVPEHWVDKLQQQGKSLSENPMGCGPFKFKKWVHDASLTLEKNPDYFHRDLPMAKRVEAQLGLSATLQMMLFEQGSLDILNITDAFPSDFLRFTTSDKWKNEVAHGPMMDIRYVSLNVEMKPFKDVRVRRAMNYAINRDRIVGFLTGRAVKAAGPLPPKMPAFNPQMKPYPYDPDKARALLKEAGYKDDPSNPIPMLYATTEPWFAKAAQSMQEDLKNVGFSISIKPMSYTELKANAGKRGTTPMAINGWLQDFPDPSNFLDVLFNSKSITETSCINRAFYSDPKVDVLLNAAGVERDRPKRLKMYEEIEKMVVADAPWVFLFHTERYIAHQPWVKNYKIHPMWSSAYEMVDVQ